MTIRFSLVLFAVAMALPAQSPALGINMPNVAPPCVATCTPEIAVVARGSPARVAIAGSSSPTFFLALGLPGGPCTVIPGINGMLSTTPAVATMLTATGFVRIYVTGGQPCFGAAITVDLPVPAGLPFGAQFSLQALVQETPAGQFGFTNSLVVIAN